MKESIFTAPVDRLHYTWKDLDGGSDCDEDDDDDDE